MTKKMVALVVSLAVVALPGTGLSNPRLGPQTVEGLVLLPTPHPQDPADCFAGIQRRFAFPTQEQINSAFGYHFDIDTTTWGGKFKLEPTGGIGAPDLDIVFYESFETDPTDPTGGPTSIEIGTRGPGGEKGTVPPTMNKAIVCLWAGESTQAAAATFKYTAVPPKKKPKR
ncbi:MAG: hypothetical protein M3345_01470 [Actinomycetota bacterium]|nr:hypothetical protein [Actinomycetota bacterium]